MAATEGFVCGSSSSGVADDVGVGAYACGKIVPASFYHFQNECKTM